MKNRRGLIIGMWCVLITCFSATTAKADDVPAPGNVKLKIETKRITQAEAEQYVKSGEKVTLGVYLVLDQGWKAELEASKANGVRGQMSFGFFNDDTYTQGDFLQDPTRYIAICADPYTGQIGSMTPPAGSCSDALKSDEINWYLGVSWQAPGAKDGHGGSVIGWPEYAYGNAFAQQAKSLYPSELLRPIYKFWRIDKDGNYEFKLFDIQFILKDYSRNFPVAILDDGVQVQGALGASELRVLTGDNDYWPKDAYNDGNPIGKDWTDLVNREDFEFIPGGLFIETAPEWEKLERSFVA